MIYQSFPNLNFRLKSLVHYFVVLVLILVVAHPLSVDIENWFYLFLGNTLILVSWLLAGAITSDAWKRFYKQDEHSKSYFGANSMSDEDIRSGASPVPVGEKRKRRKATIE
jgi:hypothetical protein